nr:hypothetical protein [Tanacetum cinerariifolium]
MHHKHHHHQISISYPPNDIQSPVNHNVYMASSSIPQMEYASTVHQQSEFSSPETGLVVLVFQKGDDPIDAINHMMSFLTAVVTSRYPATNNQLGTSSNPRQQATINNERATIQPIQGRKYSMTAGSSRPYASGSGRASRKQRINEEANSLNNGVEESDSDVVSDTYFDKNESDRPPNRSKRSNSRVLEEVSNFVDKSSSESINNGIKLKEGGSILEILEE